MCNNCAKHKKENPIEIEAYINSKVIINRFLANVQFKNFLPQKKLSD